MRAISCRSAFIFDCWNSKYQSWNAVNHGPKRDVVGTWRKAVRGNGLRYAVSEQLAWSWTWFNVNKLFCFCLGWPEGDVLIRSLGRSAPGGQGKIEAIRVLGSDETLAWTQDGDALRVAHPKGKANKTALDITIAAMTHSIASRPCTLSPRGVFAGIMSASQT